MNPARPAPGSRLCALDEIPDPGAKGFVFRQDDRMFHGFLVRSMGRLRGFIDSCPHAGLPLSMEPDRFLTRAGDLILCSAHGALFRIEDGLCVGGPCAGRSLTSWPVMVMGRDVLTAGEET